MLACVRVSNVQAEARADASRARAVPHRRRHRWRRPRYRRADRARRMRFRRNDRPTDRAVVVRTAYAPRSRTTNVSARIASLAHAGNHRKRSAAARETRGMGARRERNRP
ncbi:hypothetical protein C7S17_4616 [Burkholderia thailandensis]|nr:hypothetical protein [Burkholderia thailandensis]